MRCEVAQRPWSELTDEQRVGRVVECLFLGMMLGATIWIWVPILIIYGLIRGGVWVARRAFK